MALTHVATSTPVFTQTNVAPTVPVETATGDHAFLLATAKQQAKTFDSATFGGWTLIWSGLLPYSSTSGNLTAGNGQVVTGVFYQKVPAGGLGTPTIGLAGGGTASATIASGTLSVWRSDIGADLDITSSYGERLVTTTTGTATAVADPGYAPGDTALLCTTTTDDAPTFGASSVAATGATFSALNELADLGSALGDDNHVAIHSGVCTTGPSTAPPSFTATTSSGAGSRGGTVFLRLRETGGTPPAQATGSRTLATDSSTFDANAFFTGTIYPASNALVLCTVVVGSVGAAGVVPVVTGVAGCGLTWELADRTDVTTGARNTHVFRSMGGSPTAGSLTISVADVVGSAIWTVEQFTGVNTSGTNGSGAVAQTVNAKPASGTSANVAFPATPTAGSRLYAAVGGISIADPTPGTGWTLGVNVTQTVPPLTLWTATATTDPLPTAIVGTWTAASTHFDVGVEVKTATGGGPAAVTGTGALTASAPTVAAAGTVTTAAVTGTGAVTAPAPTLAGAGTATLTGTGALTPTAPTLAAAGTVTTTGTGALTAGSPGLAATGNVTVAGTGTLTGPAPAVAAAGTVTVTGAGALTPTGPGVAAGGTVTATGTGTLTAPAPVLAGAGNVIAPIAGTGTLTAAAPSLAAAGTVTAPGVVGGTGALTPTAPTLAGAGTLRAVGAGQLTAPAPAVAAAATITLTGTAALTAGAPTLSGAGNLTAAVVGTAALTAPATSLAAAGTVTTPLPGVVTGTGQLSPRAPTLTAAGTVTTPAPGQLRNLRLTWGPLTARTLTGTLTATRTLDGTLTATRTLTGHLEE